MSDDLVKRLDDLAAVEGEPTATVLKKAADRIKKLGEALEALSHIHDGNPSDAYAGAPELDYARHMLWEARQIAREALEEEND